MPAELRDSSVRMLGKAATIAVLLTRTASIARRDHRTGANPKRWTKLALRARPIDQAPGGRNLTFFATAASTSSGVISKIILLATAGPPSHEGVFWRITADPALPVRNFVKPYDRDDHGT